MKQLIEDLKRLGFGTDRPINGADLVDVINQHWDEIRRPVRVYVTIKNGYVEMAGSTREGVSVHVIDHDLDASSPRDEETPPADSQTLFEAKVTYL